MYGSRMPKHRRDAGRNDGKLGDPLEINMSEPFTLRRIGAPHSFSAAVAHLQLQRQAATKWILVLLLVTGVAVALADGFTRAPNADWESMPFDGPLQYVPYKAAFVFAGLLLPVI